MLRKPSTLLVCGLAVLLISLTGLAHAAPTESPATYQSAGMPPPLPRGAGRWGLPIGYEDSVCCVSGYVFWGGQPVTGAVVTIHNSSGQNITVQTDQILNLGDNANSGQQYPYFKAQLDSDTFHVQPGEIVTLTAAYAGSSKSIQYSAQPGGQQVDVVISDPNLVFDCSSANQTDLPQSECNALVAIYKSLNGPYWLNHDGWLATNTPCSWHGVGCDNGHVSVIDLDTNQLAGTLPPEIGDFPNVSKIDLPFNRLTGMIPATIGNLTWLYEFYLDRNQLSGPIPSTIGNLGGLGVLTMPDNELSGSIPTELGNLTNLWKLDLPFNQFSGPIPASLGNLSNLSELYLRDNQLSGPLPPSLGQLTELSALELADNRLTGEIPATFSGLTSLTKLSLDHNLLSGSIPASLGQLNQLNGLFLNVNLLTGPIPPELGNLTNLQWLNLSHNLLDGTIPVSLGNLVNLQELFLDTNKLSGAIPPELGNLAQLKLLFLAVNRLNGSVPSTFGNLQSLEYVNLSDNQLSGSIPPEVGNLDRLDVLYLNANRLSGAIPGELSQLTNLSYLGLNHNSLTGALPSQLGSLSDLSVLDLSYNQISGAIPPEFGNLTNLRELYLGRNQLSGVIPSQLGQLTNLNRLGVDNNQLSGTIPVGLSQLLGLTYLNLGFNHLSGPIPAELGNLTNLEQLGLHGNQLSEQIPAQLGNLTKLRMLNLHANQLAGVIPAELGNLVNLSSGWLTLSYNKLVALEPALIDFITSRSADRWDKTQTVAPTDVQAIPRSSSEIRVVWRPIAYTDHGGYYEISLATAPDGPYTVHGVTPDKASNSYTITNLPGLGTYYVRVRTYTPVHDNQQSELWSDYVTSMAATAETTCHQLTLTHSGSGSDPVAAPADNNAEGCAAGTFKPGKPLNLCAVPTMGWYVASWNGTADNTSTAPCNSLVMPNSDHIVQVTYSQTAPPTPTPTPTPSPPGGAPQTSLVHMVYVAGDNELAPYLGNFEQGMIGRMTKVGARQNVTTVVLYDGEQPGDTALYVFPATGARDMRTESWHEVQTDDPAILRSFVLDTIKEFPADSYALSIADHANGVLGIGYDYGNAATGNNYLTPSQLWVTLEQIVYLIDRKIDVLHFDGCSFGLFEDASIAQGVADYVVASPNTSWGIFAYDQYREAAGNSANDPRSFAQNIAQVYAGSLSQKSLPYTISVFDMASYDDLRLAISDLGERLDVYLHGTPQAPAALQAIRERVQKYDSGDVLITQNDYYVDLHHLALELQTTADPSLLLAANRVLELTKPGVLGSFVLYQSSASGDYYEEASQQLRQVDLAGAYGLGIYFPASQTSAGQLLNRYTNDETFPNLTPGWGWTKFLRKYLLGQAVSVQQNAIQAADAPAEDRLVAPLIPPTAPATSIPVAPSSLSAVAALPTQVILGWVDNSNNEDGFKIERSLDGTTGWTEIATVMPDVAAYVDNGLTCGTTYYYQVRAYNAGGDSAYSNSVNAQTVQCIVPPSPPSNLAATSAGSTQVNLSWTHTGDDEDGFKIERSLNGANDWTEITTVGANLTSYSDTGLPCDMAYGYRVSAYNVGGDSPSSNVANAQLPCPILPPSNLVPTPVGGTQINLNWTDNSGNESGFKIERSPDGTNNWIEIATSDANITNYANTGLTCDTTYFYRVRAYNANSVSDYSNIANVQTVICPPSPPPSNLSAMAAGQMQINLNWIDSSSNEEGFKIEQSPDGANGWVQIATVGAGVTSYTSMGLTCGTTYYYRVRAYNVGGDSGYSNNANAQTATCATPTPVPPSNLSATTVGSAQINLSWVDNSNNEDGFKLERSPDGTNNWVQLATVGANVASYSNTGLTCGASYYYRVRAYNAGGDSAYSNVANAQPPCSSDLIFKDDFESGNLLLWSLCPNSTGLSVTPAAALQGLQGLQTTISNNTPMCLISDHPNGESRYRMGVSFDPNSITMASGNAHYIFYGYSGTSTVVLRIELRKYNGAYQLRAALVNDSTSWKTSSWFTITDAPHRIEIDWKASTTTTAKNGYLTLWIDGVQKANLTGVDNDTRRIDQVRLGAVDQIDTGTRGTYYFDAFESRRQTSIGPAISTANLSLTPGESRLLVYLPLVQNSTSTVTEVSKSDVLSELLIYSIFLPEIQQ